MEAGYGAAGHGDEQYGEQIAASYLETHISGSHNCRMRSDNSHNCRDHHEIQQEAVQIISRLEQNPYRRNGRNTDVNKYKTNPEALGKVNRAYKADSDADSKQNHAYNGGNNQRRILSVNQDAENNCQRNERMDAMATEPLAVPSTAPGNIPVTPSPQVKLAATISANAAITSSSTSHAKR